MSVKKDTFCTNTTKKLYFRLNKLENDIYITKK